MKLCCLINPEWYCQKCNKKVCADDFGRDISAWNPLDDAIIPGRKVIWGHEHDYVWIG